MLTNIISGEGQFPHKGLGAQLHVYYMLYYKFKLRNLITVEYSWEQQGGKVEAHMQEGFFKFLIFIEEKKFNFLYFFILIFYFLFFYFIFIFYTIYIY
jgi:hypothetical protein